MTISELSIGEYRVLNGALIEFIAKHSGKRDVLANWVIGAEKLRLEIGAARLASIKKGRP